MTRRIGCEEAISKLLDYIDRELDATAQVEVARHIEHCRGCFSRAEFERRLRERISEIGEVEAPEFLRQRVKSMLERY
jgi:anti-sigma factor (TIGR02949 family)